MVPICRNCGTEWGWFETLRKYLMFKWKKKCPYCGHTQYITYNSTRRTAWPILPIMIAYIVLPSAGVPNKYTTSIALITLIAGLLSNPFLIKLSNNQKFPWDS